MARASGVCLSLVAALMASVFAAGPASAAPTPADPQPPDPAATSVLLVHVAGRDDIAAVHDAADNAGATVRHTIGAQDLVSIAVPAGDTNTATQQLAALPGVTAVEKPVTRTFADAVPNDPQFGRQRGYLAAVNGPAAWQTQHGSAAVRIAVIDSGVDVGHPDLAAKIVGTYNAHTGGTSVTDTVGHGTFVAGVAAAGTNNGIGGAGAGYDSSVLAVKIADSSGDISVDDEIAGIRWAADHGADVINLSLCGPDSSAAEKTAIAYAQGKGALVVAAAGNDGDTAKQYPAAYPGVVSVGATDTGRRTRADFSTHGPWVTLAAPGVGIYSSVPRSGSDFFPTTSGYALGDGTSFSTPLVAGEAALLKAQSPVMTGPRLRAALIASAHGYRGLGLGAGQVDFALALRHATPTTHPTSAVVDGAKGVLRFTASSSASRVAFRIDSGPPLATAPVVHGTATLTWSSWGQRNGAHVLHAVDCSAFGECAGPSMSTTFALANNAPVLTSPTSGRTVTGRFDVTAAASGGGARLLVDGHAAGFAARSPYDFTVNATGLADTGHALAVQSCTSDGTRCEGPLSPVVPVTSRALHPTLIALSPSTISPNGDGRLDRATLTFSLLDPEVVAVQTIDPTGTVVRLSPLGALGRGRHTWTWRGTLGGGRVLPDGRYTIALATSRVVDGFTERGWVGHAGVVDTVAPTLSGVHGNQTLFFPVKDGYRDTFAPRVTVHGSGILALAVRTRSGHLVRTIIGRRSPGATALIWNGRDTSGRLVTAGTYRWTYSITDTAGNRTNARTYSVTVSAKRLRTRTRYVSIPAARPRHRGATAACAVASPSTSAWEGGVRLTNYCSADSGDFAYVPFEFTAPAAQAYKTIAIQAYGYSRHRPSELQAAFQRSDGGLEIPHPVAVRSGRVGWVTVTTTGAAGRILTKHHVDVTLLLSSRYRGGNGFDMRSARLRITYVVVA